MKLAIRPLAGLALICALSGCGGGDTPKPDASASPLPEVGSANAEMVAAVQQFTDEMFAAMASCEAAGTATQKMAKSMKMGNSSIYEGYTTAVEQVKACKASEENIDNVRISMLFIDRASDQAKKIKSDCKEAVRSKIYAAQLMAEIFDGEMKPSKVHELGEAAKAVESSNLVCAADHFDLASKTGVDFKAIKFGDGSAS